MNTFAQKGWGSLPKPFRLKLHDKMALATTLWNGREEVLRLDPRSYPSRSMAAGVNVLKMKPFVPLLTMLAPVGRITQKEMETGLSNLDEKLKGGLKRLVGRSGSMWESWLRDYAFCVRVLLAHLSRKRSQWNKAIGMGISTRSHPDWIVSLYKAMPASTGYRVSALLYNGWSCAWDCVFATVGYGSYVRSLGGTFMVTDGWFASSVVDLL